MFPFFTNRGKLLLNLFGPFFTIIRLIDFKSIYLNKISFLNFYSFSIQFYSAIFDAFFIKSLISHSIYSNLVDFYRGNFFNYITLRVDHEFYTIFSTHLERNSNFTNFKTNL